MYFIAQENWIFPHVEQNLDTPKATKRSTLKSLFLLGLGFLDVFVIMVIIQSIL